VERRVVIVAGRGNPTADERGATLIERDAFDLAAAQINSDAHARILR
jgi:hypothetical protein